jgi:hypothetical protein
MIWSKECGLIEDEEERRTSWDEASIYVRLDAPLSATAPREQGQPE